MIIKQATIKDAEIISNIHALSWKETYEGLIPQQYLEELESDFWVESFKDWIEKNVVTVQLVYDDEVAVGCISYGKSRDAKFPEWGEIVSIYIIPEYLGKGYGRKLLIVGLEELKKRGYRDVFLWVLEENKRARKFYERNGFESNEDKYSFEIMGKEFQDVRYILNIVNLH